MEFLIGADPELFVRKGRYKVSAHDLLPGTKKDPVPVPGGAIQVDGTAAEFNIDPAKNLEEFKGNISLVVKELDERLKAIDPNYSLEAKPSRIYSTKRWESIPGSAKELGCDPDFNAYTGGMNPRPLPPIDGLRSGGGHVHVGWTKGADLTDPTHILDCRMVIKAMDFILLPLSRYWDRDKKRRQIYGNPGAFRPKSYGVEYRTLSNAWVMDEKLQEIVYRGTGLALRLLEESEEVTASLMRSNRYDTGRYQGPLEYLYGAYSQEYKALKTMASNWDRDHAVG